jgi:hypothetical protein
LAGWHYAYAGLRVRSELALPEWSGFEAPEPLEGPDVEIRLAPEAPERAPGDEGAYFFHRPGVASYRVRLGREITVAPAPRSVPYNVRRWLLGQVWAALCYQRGLLLLHACVVEVEGGAIALCGASESGKSTLGAWLVEDGHWLLSDDLCHCELEDGGRPGVWPSAPRLKLWLDAIEALGWPEDGLERDRIRLDKFFLTLHHVRVGRPLRLRAIYLLEWGDLRISRLRGLTALTRLVAEASYRLDLLGPLSEVAAHWQRCAALAREAPIFALQRPRDWSARAGVIDLLRGHWTKCPGFQE